MSVLTKKLEVKLPTTPNFITVGEHTLSIAEFSEPELRAIGRAWTDELVKAGKKKRATRPRGITNTAPATELPEIPSDAGDESLHDRAHSMDV